MVMSNVKGLMIERSGLIDHRMPMAVGSLFGSIRRIARESRANLVCQHPFCDL